MSRKNATIAVALAALLSGCASSIVDHTPYTPVLLELNQAPMRVKPWEVDRYRCPDPIVMTCSGATRTEIWCQCSSYRPAPL